MKLGFFQQKCIDAYIKGLAMKHDILSARNADLLPFFVFFSRIYSYPLFDPFHCFSSLSFLLSLHPLLILPISPSHLQCLGYGTRFWWWRGLRSVPRRQWIRDTSLWKILPVWQWHTKSIEPASPIHWTWSNVFLALAALFACTPLSSSLGRATRPIAIAIYPMLPASTIYYAPPCSQCTEHKYSHELWKSTWNSWIESTPLALALLMRALKSVSWGGLV